MHFLGFSALYVPSLVRPSLNCYTGKKGGIDLKFGFMNFDGRFSRILNRMTELVLLNFIFILTCLPVLTIGASVAALYSVTLKMARNEEGYVIRGYFKGFAENFGQATMFWIIELLLYAHLWVLYAAAAVNGGRILTAYTVITWALGILYSLYFLFVFPLTATFSNTFLNIAKNSFIMSVSHFPWALASYLAVALPLAASFGISTRILRFSLMFWVLTGFSLLFYLSSFCQIGRAHV